MAMSDEDYGRLMANSENTDKKVDKMSDTMERFISSVPCQNHEARIEGNKERTELAHVRISDHKEKGDEDLEKRENKRTKSFRWSVTTAISVVVILVSLMIFLKE